MLITRIRATHFKTYLSLDLDLTVDEERPIILIGGANGGGKTTLFEAIYGALYGLKISHARHFRELLNAGASDTDGRISLELHFSGRVLNQEQKYVLTRTYALNPAGQPVESVRLNMGGNVFQFGTATPPADRARQEAEVSKIIKANLPQELSRYFLFDAMEAGNLLKEDQLNRVIRENIENVMGFNKYMQLAKSAERLHQTYTAQRLEIEKEKQEYLALVAAKEGVEQELRTNDALHQEALQFSVSNRALYDQLREGKNQETTLRNKIEQLRTQIENVRRHETAYRDHLESFVREIELQVLVPRLTESIRPEVSLMLKQRNEHEQQAQVRLQPAQVEPIVSETLTYLHHQQALNQPVSLTDLVAHLVSVLNSASAQDNPLPLDPTELAALEELLGWRTSNAFPVLDQQRTELELQLAQIPGWEHQLAQLRAQLSGDHFAFIETYEANEANIRKLADEMSRLRAEISRIEKKIHQFDIQLGQEPDPRYEALGRLKGFFEDVANSLLKSKKQQIERKMKQDLNINLAAYRDVIDRVELSENLTNLTFRLYHKAGNEIYLNQLNTASKQVVVQVLLKALHEFGDYDPPVMIDTVMGVLDETSRTTVLENYFPALSHQTILLSSDSEIRTGKDFEKIEAFVSKTYTLQRDRERQCTDVVTGYFGLYPNA